MLYEFQKITLDNIIKAQQTKPIVILNSDEGTGKSTIIQNINNTLIQGTDYTVVKCIGNYKNKFTDYGALPTKLLNEIKRELGKKSLYSSIAKDISGTISNIIFIQTENVIDNLLSKNEGDDLEQIINFLIKKSKKRPLLLIFDALSYMDYKSHILLYSIILGIGNAQMNRIRLIISVDSEEEVEFAYLRKLEQNTVTLIQTDLPTDNDLHKVISPSLIEIGRYIPLKELLNIGNQIEDVHIYLKMQLEKNVKNLLLAEIILLSMAVFENPLTLSDIILFTNSYDDYEIYQTMSIMANIGLIDKQSDAYDEYYKISKIYRDTIMRHIPEYLLSNKLQIYIKHLENSLDFKYYQKFLVYKRIQAYESAYSNAILAYCSYARDLIILSGDEILTLKSFLEKSYHSSLFEIIEKGYSLYRKEQYEDCYLLINAYLSDNHFVTDNTIIYYSYSAEFIIELKYLIALCALRFDKITTEQLGQEQKHLMLAIEKVEHLKNEEFVLRLKELLLLIEVTLANNPNSYYFNCYFELCSAYKEKIRNSSIRSQIYWETRYGMQLLRINSISGVPNKLVIINEGFNIAKRYQSYFPNLYLRAACNYACDIMWRGQYDESYNILLDAITFINKNDIASHWGVIIQMYTFAALFAQKDSSFNLLEDYNNIIWNNTITRQRMHEQYLCLSNYAMLLAINSAYGDAYNLIHDVKAKCSQNKLYEKYVLTTNLGALAYMLGNVEEAISLENECLNMLEMNDIPNFSKPFLYKRNLVILNVYQKRSNIKQVDISLESRQVLSTGYCSDHYTRLMLFTDINYWAN